MIEQQRGGDRVSPATGAVFRDAIGASGRMAGAAAKRREGRDREAFRPLWPPMAWRVTLTRAAERLRGAALETAAFLVDATRRGRAALSGLYQPGGRLTPSNDAIPPSGRSLQGRGSGSGSGVGPIWPEPAYRVSLSHSGRLAAGVMANLEASPEEQARFLAGIREGVAQGAYSQQSFEEARRALGALFPLGE